MLRVARPAGLALALALAAALPACTDSAKAPAEAAIRTTEAGLAAVEAEANRYLPGQAMALAAELATAKAAAAKGEHKQALLAARELPAKVEALGAAIAARKADLAQRFGTVVASLPDLLAAIRERLESLSAAKKLPAGLDAQRLQAARGELAVLERDLARARSLLDAGQAIEAIELAIPLRSRARETMGLLGMNEGR